MIDTTKEPDFINPEGTKWWIDQDIIGYAKRTWGLSLACYIAETKDGYKTRFVLENGNILHDSQQLEATACFIDALAVSRGIAKK